MRTLYGICPEGERYFFTQDIVLWFRFQHLYTRWGRSYTIWCGVFDKDNEFVVDEASAY